MVRYPYLIVGGGMTAHAAAVAIRSRDRDGAIAIIGAEPHPPYKRPPLSKGLWRDESLESIWLGTQVPGLELHTGRRVVSIDRREARVRDDRGTAYGYGKLLLATGGSPRRFPWGGDRVIYYRTVDDYQRLRALADRRAEVAVIGGGFIGSEVAAALAMDGLHPVMIFPEATPGARVFPRALGLHLAEQYRKRGVRLLPGEQLAGIDTRGARPVLATARGAHIEVDAVVAGIGIQPADDLAREAGLEVHDGIVVDESLCTADPAVFAAGDVARFHNPALGTSLRVEHEDAAVTMGAAAGLAMTGEPTRYHHLPFFYSDLFDAGYEAVGITDARLEVVPDWEEPYRRGFLYYLGGGRVRGVLCWGIFGRVDEARALISEPGPLRAVDLVGRLAA